MVWNIVRLVLLIAIVAGAFIVFAWYNVKNKDRNHDDDIDVHDFS